MGLKRDRPDATEPSTVCATSDNLHYLLEGMIPKLYYISTNDILLWKNSIKLRLHSNGDSSTSTSVDRVEFLPHFERDEHPGYRGLLNEIEGNPPDIVIKWRVNGFNHDVRVKLPPSLNVPKCTLKKEPRVRKISTPEDTGEGDTAKPII